MTVHGSSTFLTDMAKGAKGSRASKLPGTEREITEALLRRLKKAFGVTPQLKCEVSADGRSRADVVALVEDKVVTIEVKRSDWKRAVAQAVLNRYCSDESYIALWESRISPEVLTEADIWGVGVLAITHRSVRIAYEAPPAIPHDRLRLNLLQHFNENT